MALTKRDILQKVKINGEDIAFACAAFASHQITRETLDHQLQGNAADIQTMLGEYDAAEP